MKYQYSTQIALSGIEVSFIYTICFLSVYRSFGIHSVISLLLTKTFNTFTYTKKYNYDDYEP